MEPTEDHCPEKPSGKHVYEMTSKGIVCKWCGWSNPEWNTPKT